MAKLVKLQYTCSMYELTLADTSWTIIERRNKSDVMFLKSQIIRSAKEIMNKSNDFPDERLAEYGKCIIYNSANPDSRKILKKLGFKAINMYQGHNEVTTMSITFKKLFKRHISLGEFLSQYFD